MAPILITVTPEDVAQGSHYSCFSCPVSLAVARALPDYYVSVSWHEVHARHRTTGVALTYPLPSHITDWIRDFDSPNPAQGPLLPPAPFTLEIA